MGFNSGFKGLNTKRTPVNSKVTQSAGHKISTYNF